VEASSHGIIAHVYLVNNCGLYLKKRRKMVHVLHVDGGIWDCNSYVPTSLNTDGYFKKLVLTLAESKLDKYKEMLT
jgi:hypothetical protein